MSKSRKAKREAQELETNLQVVKIAGELVVLTTITNPIEDMECGHRRFWHQGENGEGPCTRLDCGCKGCEPAAVSAPGEGGQSPS